jgi:two-component system, NtrC family, sensor kinase
LTYLLSDRLQNWVTFPILRLADTARRIADENDYSVRAEKVGADEVGMLTDAFNQMLSQIHAQDDDLQNAQHKLRVQLAELELEVSERRSAEEALRESQEKLLQTSRLAGMAEVATSLLHNVGNVLNSVNISGNVLNERLRGSKIAALGRVSALINQHQADFPNFVTHDPRGKRIPELVTTLNDALVEERDDLLAEVGVISKHIGHIKEIVAMQQSYSRVGGLIERVDVEDLLDDALRMNSVSITSKQIKITQEYQPVPKVQVDRHKVLQILVNILSNAKHAVDNSGRDDKQVIIRVRKLGDQFVEISVRDNGVGIAPENLNRIFAHGFTTKKSGNGFGLHCGALAASEVGGALSVQSDGIGKGATFTLELPVIAPTGVAMAN